MPESKELYGRSGSHLSSLVSVVCAIALNAPIVGGLESRYIPISDFQSDLNDKVRLPILLFASLALLPDGNVRCDKGVWDTWIEIGCALIVEQILESSAYFFGTLYDTRPPLISIFTM